MTVSMPHLAALAGTPAAGSGGHSSITGLLFPLLLLVGVFLLFRSQRRNRARIAEQSRSSLVPGAEVVTRGGLIGTVVSVSEDEVLLEAAPGVRLRMLAGAIARPLHPEQPPAGGGPGPSPEGLPPDDRPPAG